GGDDDAARPQGALGAPGDHPRALAGDAVAVAAVGGAERADLGHGAVGDDLDAAPFGQVEVVLDERVLGAHRAADHAAGAEGAARAVGTLAAEEGVRHGLPGLAEVDPDRGLPVGVADADVVAVLAQEVVGGVV